MFDGVLFLARTSPPPVPRPARAPELHGERDPTTSDDEPTDPLIYKESGIAPITFHWRGCSNLEEISHE